MSIKRLFAVLAVPVVLSGCGPQSYEEFKRERLQEKVLWCNQSPKHVAHCRAEIERQKAFGAWCKKNPAACQQKRAAYQQQQTSVQNYRQNAINSSANQSNNPYLQQQARSAAKASNNSKVTRCTSAVLGGTLSTECRGSRW